MKHDVNRRGFLRGTVFGSMGAIITSRLSGLFPEAQQVFNTPTSDVPLTTLPRISSLAEAGGELYGGFVLLPEGAPIPDIVQGYKFGIPTMCGVSDGVEHQAHHTQSDAVHVTLHSASDLAAQSEFPMYTLSKIPVGLRPSGVSLIMHGTGQLFGGTVTFEAYDQMAGTWYTAVSILAQYDFPQPFPLWSSNPVEEGGPAVKFEKVDFVPSGSGILIRNPVGFTLHWIKQGVFYTMCVEHLPKVEPQVLAPDLTLVARYS